MAFQYDSEFVFIGRGDESFLENYSYELSEDPEGNGGKIFMALEILNNQAEAEDIGEAVFANFKQHFYANRDAEPYERFEEALKSANATVEALKEEKVSRFIGNLNIALVAFVGDTLLLSTAGDAEVYLVRKRFVSVVSEGLAEDSKKETFVNIANGSLEDSDRVVLSSSRLLRYITKAELGRIFSGERNMATALAELQDFVMTEILGRASVVGVGIAEAEEPHGVFEEESSEAVKSFGVPAFLKRWMPTEKPAFLGKLSERISLGGKLQWVSSLGSKIRDLIPAKIPFKSPAPRRMPKERLLAVILVLLVALVSGVFWIRTRGDTNRQIAEQQAKLNHARELMNDATTIGQFDKPKAADLLVKAEQQAVEVLNSRFLRADAVKTLDDIQKNRDSLDDVKRVPTPALLADFSEKRNTVSALGLLSFKDRLYGFEYNALYELVLDKLQDPLTINDVETVILGTDDADSGSLLFLTRTGKMIEYKDGRFSFATTKDGIWKKGVDMKTYNGRLYVLDSERNQVWRYPRVRDGFDAGSAYNENADIKTGVSVAIDASIFVLHADGTITQLYQGEKKEYPLRRLPLNPISAPTKIFTNADLGHIYILEPSKSRVVLFRKDLQNGGAQYQTQYVFENTGVLRDLVVADNRLYVIDDKRVYFVNLSGL